MGANGSHTEEQSKKYEEVDKGQQTAHSDRLQYHGLRYPKGKFGPPDGAPSVNDVTHNSVTVTWSPPSGSPVSCVLAYHLEICRACDKRWKVVTKSCQGTRYDVKFLSPNTEYLFRVRVENVYGVSKPSHISPVVRTLARDRWARPKYEDSGDKSNKLIRRHSTYIKVESSVSNLLNRTEESENGSEIGAIPFKRNNSIRMSLPVQRRPSTLTGQRRENVHRESTVTILPGSRRESICSKDSRRSWGDSSVFTEDSEDSKVHRSSMSTEEDFCDKSTSAASMTSITEGNDVSTEKHIKDVEVKEDGCIQIPWRPSDLSESSDILSAPYSDDTKLAWVSQTPPGGNMYDHTKQLDQSPIWKCRQSDKIVNGSKTIPDLRSLRHVLNSNDVTLKTFCSDSNGNYTYHTKEALLSDTIREVDEENFSVDIISSL